MEKTRGLLLNRRNVISIKSRKVSILLQVRSVSIGHDVLLTVEIYILVGEEVKGEFLAVHLDKTKGLLLSRRILPQ